LRFVQQHSLGSIIGDVAPVMQTRRKKEKRSDWWLTVEHIGRELRKLYPPGDTPPGLHALFTKERRRTSAMHQSDQGDDNKDDGDSK
jgi:hypothetical protein